MRGNTQESGGDKGEGERGDLGGTAYSRQADRKFCSTTFYLRMFILMQFWFSLLHLKLHRKVTVSCSVQFIPSVLFGIYVVAIRRRFVLLFKVKVITLAV